MVVYLISPDGDLLLTPGGDFLVLDDAPDGTITGPAQIGISRAAGLQMGAAGKAAGFGISRGHGLIIKAR